MATEKEKQTEKVRKKSAKSVITIGSRGRTFEGIVTKNFAKRAVIEFEKTSFIKKYERFQKKKTRIHARIPEGMEISVGDLVKARQCRPLSKIIHFIVIDIVKKSGEAK